MIKVEEPVNGFLKVTDENYELDKYVIVERFLHIRERDAENDFRAYKYKVAETLQKQLNKYTQRALLLKEPYGDVTKAIHDIADELGVDLMTDKIWSLNTNIIEGTDICQNGIPHTNRSIVTVLNRYERELTRFQNELREAIKNERTELGRRVLINLADNLGVDL